MPHAFERLKPLATTARPRGERQKAAKNKKKQKEQVAEESA
jgi:hypothetical protein